MNDRTGTLVASALGITVVQLNATVVTVAFESLRQAFDVDVAALQWAVNAYALLLAALLLSAGLHGDRYGAWRVFAVGFAVSGVAAVAAFCAGSYPLLIAMRGLQGVGAALLLPASLTLLNEVSPNAEARSEAIGVWSGAGSLALALGPVVGGVLIGWAGWPVVFLPTVLLCQAGLWLTLRYAPRSAGTTRKHLDWPGQLIAMVALASFIWGIRSAAQGWQQPVVWLAAAVFCAAVIGFMQVEWRSDAPMLPPDLFRNAVLATVTVVRAFVNLSY